MPLPASRPSSSRAGADGGGAAYRRRRLKRPPLLPAGERDQDGGLSVEHPIKRGDIIQVPRSALGLPEPEEGEKPPRDIFGVVISAPFLADAGRQYLVAMVSSRSENPEIEVEISSDSPFNGWVVAASVIVNVLDEQLQQISPIDRKRGRLSGRDLSRLDTLLREILGLQRLKV